MVSKSLKENVTMTKNGIQSIAPNKLETTVGRQGQIYIKEKYPLKTICSVVFLFIQMIEMPVFKKILKKVYVLHAFISSYSLFYLNMSR